MITTQVQTTEIPPNLKKVVKTIRAFCASKKERMEWPSSESAVRAIIQLGEKNPFASAILRFNRRVLVDEVEWEACLARLQKNPKHQPIEKQNGFISKQKRTKNEERAPSQTTRLV